MLFMTKDHLQGIVILCLNYLFRNLNRATDHIKFLTPFAFSHLTIIINNRGISKWSLGSLANLFNPAKIANIHTEYQK